MTSAIGVAGRILGGKHKDKHPSKEKSFLLVWTNENKGTEEFLAP